LKGKTEYKLCFVSGHADLIRLLTYSGVDLQKPDNFGSTPLHLACLSGNVSCVKLLCEKVGMAEVILCVVCLLRYYGVET
jgi:ankyrin repeat protein